MPQNSLTLPSCIKSIAELQEYIKAVVDHYQISEEKFPDILISLTEAVNNAIVHGNKEDSSKRVQIHIRKTASKIFFVVSDEGNGFDPKEVPDPTLEENLNCCGGRGVYLMKALADDIHYHNNGSTVEICFDV